MTDETILVLGDLVFPAGSARGITQTFSPIDNGDVRRTVNGTLIDLTREQNRKFESQIRLQDMATPTLAGIWKGRILNPVEFIVPFREAVSPASDTHTIIRPPVTGTVFGYDDATGDKVFPSSVVGQIVTFDDPVNFIQYRPSLIMMVVALTVDGDEYQAEEGYTIDLEEV